MRKMKSGAAKLAPGAPPMGEGAALGVPGLPHAPKRGAVKPRLRTRHLSTAGKSAFGPAAGAAFAPPGMGAADPGAAFAGSASQGAAAGDQGD